MYSEFKHDYFDSTLRFGCQTALLLIVVRFNKHTKGSISASALTEATNCSSDLGYSNICLLIEIISPAPTHRQPDLCIVWLSESTALRPFLMDRHVYQLCRQLREPTLISALDCGDWMQHLDGLPVCFRTCWGGISFCQVEGVEVGHC